MEILNLGSNRNRKKIDNSITSDPNKEISENLKYFNNLSEICFDGKKWNKIGNGIGDEACEAIFNNAKYLTNLKALYLYSKELEYLKIGCDLTDDSVAIITDGARILTKLNSLNLASTCLYIK